MENSWNSRTLSLLGEEKVSALSNARVLVVGVGGVGGYTVEMLARAGVGHLTLVDADNVSETNINRQLIAMRDTVGKPKVQLFRERIANINPECEVEAMTCFLSPDNAGLLLDRGFDFVADCIDTVAPKIALLAECHFRRIRVISSMGAGGRIDPAQVQYADLWATRQDGLARAVRAGFKKKGLRPSVPVVYSPEAPVRSALLEEVERNNKRSSYGTLATIPSLFGIYMASYIIRKLTRL